MVHAVVEGLLEGFPNIRHELTRFESAVQSGRVAPCDFFTGKRGQREQRIHLWAQEIGIPPLRLLFILSHVKRMILDGRQKSLQGAFREADWHKGYCPFCGAFPGIALIDGTGRARRLHCFQCGQTWHFSLSVCPWCEGERKEETAYFYIDDDDRGAAFACEKCRRYLITTRRQHDPGDCRLYFAAMGLAYLDLIMQQKGYLPMVDWGWNIFATYS
jgi:FdhE protein